MKSPGILCVCVCVHSQPLRDTYVTSCIQPHGQWKLQMPEKRQAPADLSSLLLSLSSVHSGCSLLLHIPGHQLQTEVHLFPGKKNILDATRKFLVGVKPQSCLLWSCVRKLPEQSVCNSNTCNEGYNKFWFKSGKEIHVVTLTLEDINEVVFAWGSVWGLEDALWHMNWTSFLHDHPGGSELFLNSNSSLIQVYLYLDILAFILRMLYNCCIPYHFLEETRYCSGNRKKTVTLPYWDVSSLLNSILIKQANKQESKLKVVREKEANGNKSFL